MFSRPKKGRIHEDTKAHRNASCRSDTDIHGSDAQRQRSCRLYAIVQKVVFEPNDKAPERIQIWGVFALADTVRGGNSYTKPQHGYLYYSLPKGKESTALKEWADFNAVAGTGQGIAFGTRYAPLGKVRVDSEKPGSPDSYSDTLVNGIGVTKVNPAPGYQDNMTDIIAQLKAALKTS